MTRGRRGPSVTGPEPRRWVPWFLVLVLSSAPAAAQSDPLQAMPVWKAEVDNRWVVLTLRNTASETITAWAVRGRVTYEDGSTEGIGVSSDAGLTGYREGGADVPRAFTPGSSITTRFGLVKDRRVTSLSIVPTLVIFANGMAIGDERAIAFTFESRRREHDALQLVAKLLADVMEKSGARWETLEAIDRRMDDPRTQSIRDSTAFGLVRQNVRLWMRSDQGDQERAAFRLQYLLGDIRSKLALAKEHMLRR